MKTLIRNLLSILRRFKMATTLNIAGLSVGFAAFMVIIMQVDYDYNFDRMHPKSEQIFRVELKVGTAFIAVNSRGLADAFAASSPHILSSTITDPWVADMFFSVDDGGQKNHYQERSIRVEPTFTDLFTFTMVEGSERSLQEPGQALIPQSLARKLFGDSSPLGKQLSGQENYTVGGVYRDFPSNTIVENAIYTAIPPDEDINVFKTQRFNHYILVDQPANAGLLFDNFKANFDMTPIYGNEFKWDDYGDLIRLTPLADIHFTTDTQYDNAPKTSRQSLLILLAIAFVIILIAAINFTNFNTALAPMRIRSINTQKILGSREQMIRFSLLAEAMIISLVSYGIALGLVYLFRQTSFALLVTADLAFTARPIIVAGTAVLALLSGLLAGLYPSYYMTSFPPVLVLKGNFGLSPSGRKLRNVLIGIQYIASFVLIIGASFMYLQNRYMQHSPLGYDKDVLIVSDINPAINQSREAFTNRLLSFADIEGVTYAQHIISSQDQYNGRGTSYRGKDVQFQSLAVDPSFLEVLGIEITEGRGFRREDLLTRYGAFIFNERARHVYEMELNTMVDSAQIVGFMPDVKFASFRTEVEPMAFFVYGTQYQHISAQNYVYVKAKGEANLLSALHQVREALADFDADYPFNVRFYDAVLQQAYERELALSQLITLFSLIAIFISIVGVFGLVVFDSEYRRKEIGIRKILGSTTRQVLLLFNTSYVRIFIGCFVIAVPLAYYIIADWLKNFAYKTPMYWWVFAISFLLVALITIATVTFQSWRVANANPADSIKTE